jgi:hypothetical protein
LKFRFGNLPEEQKEPDQNSVEPADPADPAKMPGMEGWHRIHSPSWRLGYTFAGLVGLAFIFMLLVWLIIVSLFTDRSGLGNGGGGDSSRFADVLRGFPGIICIGGIFTSVVFAEWDRGGGRCGSCCLGAIQGSSKDADLFS